jgi:outer membrane protein TolC
LAVTLAAVAATRPARAEPPQAETAIGKIEDPLLTPPPGAPRTLASWDEAIALVRAHSPDYRRSHDSVLRAEAMSRVALAGLLPSLTGNGSFTHQFITTEETLGSGPITIPPQDVLSATATAVWPIASPRAWYALGTSKRAIDVAKYDLADKRRTIAETLVSLMIATIATARTADLSRSALRSSLERVALAEARVRAQHGTELDLDRAREDAEAARQLVISSDEALRRSREALGVAFGSSVAISAPNDHDLAGFERAVASTCRLNPDIEQRPDVAAARARVTLAERMIGDVDRSYMPSASLQSQLAWGSQVLYGPSTTWNVQAMVTVPIWDGGARYGLGNDARAAADQARAALEAARVQALVNVAQAERAVTVATAARDVAKRRRDVAAQVDARTRAAYAAGLATSLDLVTSGQASRVAETNLAVTEFEHAKARVLALLSKADCSF